MLVPMTRMMRWTGSITMVMVVALLVALMSCIALPLPVDAALDVDWLLYTKAADLHQQVRDIARRNGGGAAEAGVIEEMQQQRSDGAWIDFGWAKKEDGRASDIVIVSASNPNSDAITLQPATTPAGTLLNQLLHSGRPTWQPPDPLRVLLNFGEHGRELISSEVALAVMKAIDMDAASEPHQKLFIAFLLTHAELKITPLLNVWSHVRVEEGHACERKNANGVDLNRNWNYLWSGPEDASAQAQRRAPIPQDEQYPGPSAFSEFESRTLRDLATEFRPDLYINYHSGIREMYCGWDHRQELIPNAEEVLRLLNHMNTRCQCAVGGAGIIGGYVVFGGSMDYLYDKVGVDYSITVEVYGGPSTQVSASDCYRYFNPHTKELLDQTTQEWMRMTIDAITMLVKEKKSATFPWKLMGWQQAAGDSTVRNRYLTHVELDASLTPEVSAYSRVSIRANPLLQSPSAVVLETSPVPNSAYTLPIPLQQRRGHSWKIRSRCLDRNEGFLLHGDDRRQRVVRLSYPLSTVLAF
jgi:hypothetical protein